MLDELKLIEELKITLSTDSADKQFVRTNISSIIPKGLAAYSINLNNKVTGIKIGDISKNIIEKVLSIVSNFRSLQRVILYARESYELPANIVTQDLQYMAVLNVVKFPKELFNNTLSYSGSVELPHLSFSKDKEKVSKLLKQFKEYNPHIDIPLSVDEIIKGDFALVEIKYKKNKLTFPLYEEVRLFCAITDKSRAKIISQFGIFNNNSLNGKIVQEPPFEIVNQGVEAIRQYFKEKEKQGIERLFEAKIVIVGAGESGKTTLIRKLKNPKHPVPNAEDKRTEGIRVTTYPFRGLTKYGGKDIQAHIWDFGGQELYHTTHQLFLTPDTLYILLNDNRKNDTDFYYWLNIVTLRTGESSPILMIFNAKDNAARQIIPGKEIYNTFPNLIRNSIDINFADKDITSIQKMKETIEGYFVDLEVLGKPFPAYWVKVRDALAKIADEHISWDEFSKICEQNDIFDIAQMKILATTLHNLGVLLYFPEVFGLDNLVILKSQWCIDAIYSALDTKNIILNGGKFNEQVLNEKWSEKRFAGSHLQLLRLMQHFDLCYKIDGTKEYIAPQLLPIEEHSLLNYNKWATTLQFDYIFMPSGLITRLIARMSLYIKAPYVWRYGVVLEWEDGTLAEIVEHQLTHKIVIKINGPDKKRRLLEIRRCLYDLQKDFRGLKFKESVSCNCVDCSKGGEVTLFELKELQDDAEHGDDVTCRNGTRKKIPAKYILDGISYTDKPRIFISYSHSNENLKNEFRTMISPMEKEGKWDVWDDRWLLPGDNWNKEIVRHLYEANVIVLMLTADFFKSNFIYGVELARAIQRHESGEALIIGIIVSDCMWEETPLSKIQMLPKDGLPIDRHPHRNEVWKTVANKIKETISIRQGKSGRIGGWGSSD